MECIICEQETEEGSEHKWGQKVHHKCYEEIKMGEVDGHEALASIKTIMRNKKCDAKSAANFLHNLKAGSDKFIADSPSGLFGLGYPRKEDEWMLDPVLCWMSDKQGGGKPQQADNKDMEYVIAKLELESLKETHVSGGVRHNISIRQQVDQLLEIGNYSHGIVNKVRTLYSNEQYDQILSLLTDSDIHKRVVEPPDRYYMRRIKPRPNNTLLGVIMEGCK